ncbi:hypothetical protein CTI12_AA177890 [Artemisia annua]|uniref:Uncharacterized protein n=1 Tax=Artemisia annua TaxID=35608 RepID=A0A2U1P920_ARTAN|nr:hypothetical protein CTI12_AA177890 [Artemisia annua]
MDHSDLVKRIQAGLVRLEEGIKMMKDTKEAIDEHVNKLVQMNDLEGLDVDQVNQLVRKMKDLDDKIRLSIQKHPAPSLKSCASLKDVDGGMTKDQS